MFPSLCNLTELKSSAKTTMDDYRYEFDHFDVQKCSL
jgi:hypothetical protein